MQIMSCKYPPPDFSVLYKINWDWESHTSCDSATGLAAHQLATLTFTPLNPKQPSQLVQGADLLGVQVAKPCGEWQKRLGEPSEVSAPHHSPMVHPPWAIWQSHHIFPPPHFLHLIKERGRIWRALAGPWGSFEVLRLLPTPGSGHRICWVRWYSGFSMSSSRRGAERCKGCKYVTSAPPHSKRATQFLLFVAKGSNLSW